MGGASRRNRCLQLESKVLLAFESERERYTSISSPPHLRQRCTDCRAHTLMVHDCASGDTICKNCGVVSTHHHRVETPYGRGVGGYSQGSVDGIKLDLLTGAKALEGGRTRKYYKTLLKRAANNEIDGLVNDEAVRETAKLMFQRFTDRLDVVRDRAKVIQACISAAESRTRRIARAGVATPQFRCSKCELTFSSKKERRFHACLTSAGSNPNANPNPSRRARASRRRRKRRREQ